MKKIILIAALALAAMPAIAQKRNINAHWCALGTSITWYNENVSSSGTPYTNKTFTKGYQDRVKEKINFKKYTNAAVNGGALKTAYSHVVAADYYTIEHGINDWGQSIPVGTMNDYINNTNNGTFAAEYRKLIDRIYTLNPKAKIVICTPRKGQGFNGYLPASCETAKNGIYLREYAEMAKQIAAYEGIPVADFYNLCGGSRELAHLSLNNYTSPAVGAVNGDHVHPNDLGYQRMANVLIEALEKVLVD